MLGPCLESMARGSQADDYFELLNSTLLMVDAYRAR